MTAEGGLEWVRVIIRGRNAHAGWRYRDVYPQREKIGEPTSGLEPLTCSLRVSCSTS